VGVTGVAAAAYRPAGVEQALLNREPTDEAIADAAAGASDGVVANEDLHAGAEYRLLLARVLTRRALIAARDRAGQRGRRAGPERRARRVQ
jgi:carbon-monoxide dehydrogenase medium subunit